MKFASLAAFGLAVLAVPAAAQTTPAPAAPTAPSAPAALFSVETPIEALVADARSKAVLDKYLPGIDQVPQYDMFKAMSLKAIAPYSQGMISDDLLAKIEADLAAIK